jgi:hypothetical protein
VPSSISSSDARLPAERWGRVWGAALLLVAVLLGGWEGALREEGVVPSVASRQSVWIASRVRVRPASTVAAGTSRLLAGLDPDVWAAATGEAPPIQLSVLGGSSIRLLEHLAASPEFHGLVVADIVPIYTFDTDSLPALLVDRNTDAYTRALKSPADLIEAYLRTRVPGMLAFRRQEFSPDEIAKGLLHGAMPGVPALEVRADGYAPLHYRAVGAVPNADRVMQPETFSHLRASLPDSAAFARQLGRLAKAVAAIKARGGAVVLIYMPGCGGRGVIEERLFPKSRYWDSVVVMPGVVTLDLEEYPGFGELACFDGSHLDSDDARKVTGWIAHRVVPDHGGQESS